jgi:hypothetical protein
MPLASEVKATKPAIIRTKSVAARKQHARAKKPSPPFNTLCILVPLLVVEGNYHACQRYSPLHHHEP